MKKFAFVLPLLVLFGCTGPGVQTLNDGFDDSIIVRQSPVLANRPILTSDDAAQDLGFEWKSKTPDIVFLTAGYSMETKNVENVEFNADDQLIHGILVASSTTEFKTDTSGGLTTRMSYRRFEVPMEEFKKMAVARVVKMKISSLNTYTVSRFGQDYPDVWVSKKFAPFLAAIEQAKGGKTKM